MVATPLVLLLRHLLGTVFRHGVGDLVSQHDGRGGLVLRVGQDAFEDDDLASGHAESVGLWVLDEVELPVEVVHLTGEAVVSEVGLDGIGEVAPLRVPPSGCWLRWSISSPSAYRWNTAAARGRAVARRSRRCDVCVLSGGTVWVVPHAVISRVMAVKRIRWIFFIRFLS